MCRRRMSILFNEICVYKEMLPKYTRVRTHTHTHTHIYIYIYIYINGKVDKSNTLTCLVVIFRSLFKEKLLQSLHKWEYYIYLVFLCFSASFNMRKSLMEKKKHFLKTLKCFFFKKMFLKESF